MIISFKLILPALLIGCLCISNISSAQSVDHRHSLWAAVLRDHVQVTGPKSTVDYRAIKDDPTNLDRYLTQLKAITKAEYSQFSKEEKLAFLINAYNAFTVKLIVDHYPVTSIKKIGGWFSSPWKISFFKLLGTPQTLDGLEHDMLRKNFSEARIHFALVCASRGCPALRSKPFTADTLDQELEAAARTFLSDATRNRFDAEGKILYLSKIFDWFSSDFTKGYGSVPAFVATRLSGEPEVVSQVLSPGTKIKFLNYDWSLNSAEMKN